MPATRWTTGLEIVAYVIAHLLGIVIAYVLNFLYLAQLYRYVIDTYGVAYLSVVSLTQSVVIMLIVLFIFLALRATTMGGAPRSQM